MRASARIFWILAVFFLIVAIMYGLLTGLYEPLGIEPVGFPAILALAGLAAMIGTYLTLNNRKFGTRPEDRLDAEVEDEAGVQGSFAPYSWWPLWASLGAALVFLGVAAGWWIFALGIIVSIYGVIGWVMEFSTGQYTH
ncbi:cytochrome c oxidase subunit 4 [Brachybacterium epidermidis]|uniref:cytochrome c oxidase subunit 4 n=1 Tax=Brachybacterium epidermidis TaxID=2781983 RepID=UPI00398E61F1